MKPGLLLTSGDDAPLLLEAARQADRRGLAALWLPEGDGLFPNPAVTAAAVAVATRRLGIRAILTLPLHNPIRTAEEWSLLDNLSGGRAGISLDSFPLSRRGEGGRGERGPGGEDSKPHEPSLRDIPSDIETDLETVRHLWRGDAVRVPDGEGRLIDIRILPQPVQRDLPLWRLLAEPDAAAASEGPAAGLIPAFTSVEEGLRELRLWKEIGVEEVACRVRLADAPEALDVLEEILRHGG